jgi:putative transposase
MTERELDRRLFRTVFAQPDAASAHAQLGAVVERLAPSFPKAADTLLRAETDLLAYLAEPLERWSKVWATNPIERLNRELARRNDVVGNFPKPRVPHPPRGLAPRRAA